MFLLYTAVCIISFEVKTWRSGERLKFQPTAIMTKTALLRNEQARI